jgi:hypothetical protein
MASCAAGTSTGTPVAVKNDRILIYLLTDTGEDGEVNMQYVLSPSDADDLGYWGGFAYISGREKLVGAQAEHVVIYDVVMGEHVPVENTSDAIITRLPDETQRLKVHSVGYLRSTGEKIARCSDVSDADYTLVTD